MLHIVNGDTIVEKLKHVLVHDEIMAWREIYTEGALSEKPSSSNFIQKRAKSLKNRLGIPPEEYIKGIHSQESRLDQAIINGEEIVLWFEHDLFDQTILWYLLYRLQHAKSEKGVLSPCYLLSINEFPGIVPFHGMGQLSSQQLESLAGTWTQITDEQLKLGHDMWKAYTSPAPIALEQLISKEGTSALPYLNDAAAFHLQRFPSVSSGLDIIEQAALIRLINEPMQAIDLFRQVTDEVILFGMGDLQFWNCLHQLKNHSLIDYSNPLPTYSESNPAFRDELIRITPDGEKVLNGTIDRIKTYGINKWLGGAHLQVQPRKTDAMPAKSDWRWDQKQQKIIDLAE